MQLKRIVGAYSSAMVFVAILGKLVISLNALATQVGRHLQLQQPSKRYKSQSQVGVECSQCCSQAI